LPLGGRPMGASSLFKTNVVHATSSEFATNVVASTVSPNGPITATGVSPSYGPVGNFNISVWGTFTGTITLNRSFDNGTTWIPFTYSDGTQLSWSGPFTTTFEEPEPGVLYQLSVTYSSGSINYRFSQ
jgi:hypothetical protein